MEEYLRLELKKCEITEEDLEDKEKIHYEELVKVMCDTVKADEPKWVN